jgi:RNA polymerase sigma factor (sigma-70 family)
VTLDNRSDERLFRRFCIGEEECSGRFVKQFWRRVYWVAFRIVGDSGSAEDIAQIAFERAWRNGLKFDPGRGSLETWLTTIARNAALDWLRMKRPIPIDSWETHARSTSESFDPEGCSDVEATRTKVRSALSTLSPNLARSIVLAGAFDMTAVEVAQYERIPLGTAKTRIRVAKQCLRREISPTYDSSTHLTPQSRR